MAIKLLVTIVALHLLVFIETRSVSKGHNTTNQDFTPSLMSTTEANLCLTSDCAQAAGWILSLLNTSADPCYDMAEFACGGWIKNHSEKITNSTNVFDLHTLARKQLEKMVESAESSPDNSTAHKIIRGYFSSCMNEKHTSDMRNATIDNIVAHLTITNASAELNSTVLTELLYRVLELNTAPLFAVNFRNDERNKSRHIIVINLPSEWRISEEKEEIELLYSVSLLQTIESIFESDAYMSDFNSEIISIKQLQQRFSIVNWSTLFNRLFGISISDDTEVLLDRPEYMRRLQEIILETSDQREIYEAILIKALNELLHDEVIVLSANDTIEKRQFCINIIIRQLSRVLNTIYVQQLSPAQLNGVRIKSEEMVMTLKRSIASTIEESTWLDEFSRWNALDKLSRLRAIVGAPEAYFDSAYLEKMMTSINIDGLDFLAATWQIKKFNHKWNCDLYAKPSNLDTLLMLQSIEIPVFNPYHPRGALYSSAHNTIYISLGMMIESLFLLDAPNYLSLGSLGHTIAHEMHHALSTKRVDFFSPETKRVYLDKRNCLSRQFTETFQQNVSVYGTNVLLKLDGESTMEENLADLGGMITIVTAQMLIQTKNTTDLQHLPGLTQYTNEQMMLVRASQMFCSVMSVEMYAQQLRSSHTPYPERINGIMMNLPEFGRIFSCPIGSRMNPKTKCSIW